MFFGEAANSFVEWWYDNGLGVLVLTTEVAIFAGVIYWLHFT